MAKVNYSYEKRGRELEKQKKKEEKRLKKLADKNPPAEEGEATSSPVPENPTDV
jgi:hypothetical protein